jgi:hypothetical protein
MNKFSKLKYFILLLFIVFNTANAQVSAQEEDFIQINKQANWKLKFSDKGKSNYQNNWFLDGLKAKITNSNKGLLFSAGQVEGNDADHAVLWTKQSFAGDIKITYEFTKIDHNQDWVNIIYIHATGIGVKPFDEDISKWNNLRTIPAMSTYFKNMNALHVSYAAFDKELPRGQDYIRVRKYPIAKGANFNQTTEIPPAFFDTQLFKTGIKYQLTLIKKGNQFYFQVKGDNEDKVYNWDISSAANITEGRVGLRHMYTRSSLYKNFKIYTIN